MKVAEIWRYPVKSMAGEMLESASVTSLGTKGDRVVHVEDTHGRLITARTHPRLMGRHARLNSDGEPLVDGIPWMEPQVRDSDGEIVGQGARLVRDDAAHRFDVLPLLVTTDGAMAAFGHDGRCLRPNIVVGEVDGLAERDWPGSRLRIGNVIIGIQDLRACCVVTTFDPDMLEQDREVLLDIVKKFGGKIALNCNVIQSGRIKVGYRVDLVSHRLSG